MDYEISAREARSCYNPTLKTEAKDSPTSLLMCLYNIYKGMSSTDSEELLRDRK